MDNAATSGTPVPGKKKDRKSYSIIDLLFGRKKKNDDNSFRVMLILMTLGLLILIIISFWAWLVKRSGAFGAVLGLSVTVGLAALVIGGFLGFLFGIPRSLQRENGAMTNPVNGQNGERYYSNNTNLEQISDWLTKIIVGVSLTQLPAIQNGFHQLSTTISNGFNGYMNAAYSYPLGAGIMIFYAICGFLAVYLWAKIYLLQQLTKVEDDLNRRNLQQQVERVSKLEIARLSTMLTEFNRTKNRLAEMESQSEYKDIVERAAPAPATYIEDWQKARWGEKNESQGYKLDASFRRNPVPFEEPFVITATVGPIDPVTPLTGKVYFFLHDSFFNEYIKVAEAKDNKASIEFPSFEAFTIGAVCNNGNVKLELDLNAALNCPDNYKYTSPLVTYEEVRKELEQLKAEAAKSST